MKFLRLELPSMLRQVPPGDLTGLAIPSLPEDPGKPTCTVLGTEARSSSLFPVSFLDAAIELLSSESGMRSGESSKREASGLSIHLHAP